MDSELIQSLIGKMLIFLSFPCLVVSLQYKYDCTLARSRLTHDIFVKHLNWSINYWANNQHTRVVFTTNRELNWMLTFFESPHIESDVSVRTMCLHGPMRHHWSHDFSSATHSLCMCVSHNIDLYNHIDISPRAS